MKGQQSLKKFDNILLIFSILFPLTTIPQILQIWVHKNATNISLLTWSAYLILSIPFLIYGILHKEKPIILMYSLWILVDLLVVIGVVLY